MILAPICLLGSFNGMRHVCKAEVGLVPSLLSLLSLGCASTRAGWQMHAARELVLLKGGEAGAQVLGAKRKTLAGFSSTSVQPHQGFITSCDIIQQTPPGLRTRAARLVGAKAALLARVDAFGQDPSGQTGSQFKVHAPLRCLLYNTAPCVCHIIVLLGGMTFKYPFRVTAETDF